MEEILRLEHIYKSFPGVKALQDVSLSIGKGEVRGLVGENGAGKSTLMKILTGVYEKDEGKIVISNEEVKISNPLEAQKHGLSIIFQEMNLVDNLSIAENIYVGRLPKKGIKGIDWNAVDKQAMELIKRVGLTEKTSTKVEQLSIAEKQMVEIAKALSFHSKIIIMDEPSASLTDSELEHLFEIIEALKKEGITIIYISHRLDEIFRLCNTVTVIRDGQVIDTQPIELLDRETIISKMVGRSMEQEYPTRNRVPDNEVIMKVEDLSRDSKFHHVSFEVKKGEILGIAGLVGSGRTEIVRCIFGADKASSGRIYLKGKEVQIHSPKDAIRNGIALVTEDRKGQGLVLAESVAKNTTLARLESICLKGLINKKREQQVADNYLKQLHTKAPSVHTSCLSLSGGNQQKVVLAKWLYTEADVLILDEPTRGIDVGAKYEIYQLMNQLVDEGKSIIMISSEMPEVIHMSDRLLVIHEGELKGELIGADMSAEEIMKKAILKGEK